MTDIRLDDQLLELLKQTAADKSMSVDDVVVQAVRSYLRQLEQEQMAENIQYFLSHRAELIRLYPNEYVAVYANEVVDHELDFQVLHRRIRKRFGRTPVLVRHVQLEQERIWNMRSPLYQTNKLYGKR